VALLFLGCSRDPLLRSDPQNHTEGIFAVPALEKLMPTAPLSRSVRWLLALSIFAAPASAQFDPHSPLTKWPAAVPRPLPEFDARLDARGKPAGDLHERNAALLTEEVAAARAADERELRARIPLLRIVRDSLFGTPRWIASTVRLLTAPADASLQATDVVRSFVAGHSGLFGIPAGELDAARRSRDYLTRHNGVRHLTYQQQIGGVDLFGAELLANVTRRGEIINLSSTMLPRPAGDFATSTVSMTPRQAIRAAAGHIGSAVTVDPVPASAERGASRRQTWRESPDFRHNYAVTTELVYFPVARDDIRAAWRVVLPEKGIGNTYDVIVDASTGALLRRQNQLRFAVGGTQPVSLNVYTSDSPAPGSPGTATPNGFQFPFVQRTLVNMAAGTTESPNGWIDDGDNDTQGNNVDAHTDLDDDDNPDLPRPTGNPFRVFDFAQDNTTPPSAWHDASVTNLFYFCNVYHDRLFALGFDEAAGNFQRQNFSGQGLGTDRVIADAQDGGGTNNANFGTPPDGGNGWMQMYVWDQPSPARDGDLDSDIVFHEHSHGLSFRLHDLFLDGDQAGGMGEGWGDFIGICLNAESADDPDGVYVTGGYSLLDLSPGFTDNYYFGIRRFPYTSDLGKNPATYADTDPFQQSYPPGIPRSPLIGNIANEVHNIGDIWCETLIDVRSGLWVANGFAANQLILQLVVDGMKLDPHNPTLLEARDAIIQADLVNNAGANAGALWTRFAKRGLGYSAVSPNGGSTDGVVEAFNLPVVFEYPEGVPTRLDPGVAKTFKVNVAGVGSFVPVSGSGTLNVSVNGGAFAPIAMTQTSQDHYDATIPAGACLDEIAFYVGVDTNFGPVTSLGNGVETAFKASVETGTLTVFGDDFETDKGWTSSINGATTGAWERGVPVNDPGWPYDPTSDGDGSGQCYLTMNQAGNTDVDGGSVTLVSPDIDMTGGADLRYAYFLILTVEDGADQLLVEIDSNGGQGPWIPIAHHTLSGNWRTNTISAAELTGLGVTFTSTMRVRFTANDGGTPSIVEAGVDGFRTVRTVCQPLLGTASCAGDGLTAACPCQNSGAPGHGCENSAGTRGAVLVASGATTPSDTVVLTTTGELPSSTSIVIQGQTLGSPVLYGDGLRCVGTTLKRMYVKAAFGGALTVPDVGDLSISARSAALGDPIPSGATRHYMTYYVDTSASFCPTGGTFNASNVVSIVW
jgi:hypothetical protein